MLGAPSAIMLPQLASGGLMPMPRNDNDASSRSTFPTPDAAHQDGIDPALVVARDRPHERSERNRHQRPQGADAERHACAVHHPAPEITAQVVRSQQKCPRRCVIREMNDVELLVRIEGRDERRRQRGDDQKRQDPEAPRGCPLAEKSAPALAAQPAVAEGADGFGGDDQRDEQREPRAQRHAVSTWVSGSARTRSRGSAMPRRMSASRFPATTTTLTIKAVAVTSE